MNDRHVKKSITIRPDEDIRDWIYSKSSSAESVNSIINRLLRTAIELEEKGENKLDTIIARLDALEKTLIEEIRGK